MKRNDKGTSAADLAGAVEERSSEHYVLRLYIIGTTGNSAAALANTRALCEAHLHGRYDLEIIDIREQPALAAETQIVAAPMLVKAHPLPARRFVGDMSQTDRLLIGLDLPPESDRPNEADAGGIQS